VTNDEKFKYWIEAVEREIAMLKEDRKQLNKKIIKNRQDIASMQNTLRKLKDERRHASE
jgi:septal ring factor EnvC (AmiA/AmiB activator)